MVSINLRKCLKKFGLSVLLGMAFIQFACAAHSISVYSISSISLVNVPGDLSICQLDIRSRIALPINVTAEPQQADDIQAWVNAHPADIKTFAKQMFCRYQASFLGIRYLPAVVMDNHYVVYGKTNVGAAIHALHTYLKSHRALNNKGEFS